MRILLIIDVQKKPLQATLLNRNNDVKKEKRKRGHEFMT
jgi:hypothetical protein